MQKSIKNLKGMRSSQRMARLARWMIFISTINSGPSDIWWPTPVIGFWVEKYFISPIARKADTPSGRLKLPDADKKQVEVEPEHSYDKPVSRQHEAYYYDYYGYPYYWTGPYLWGPMSSPQIPRPRSKKY